MIKFSIISKFEKIAGNNGRHIIDENDKEQRSKNGPLGYTTRNWLPTGKRVI